MIRVNSDVAVVGAGIVGLSIAYELLICQPGCKVVVIDKEDDVAVHQSGRNSGVIHSGIYYEPGSQKAINCRRGYDLLLEFCRAHQVPFELTGKVIAATHEDQLSTMHDIHARGIANGLTDLSILDNQAVQSLEPAIAAVAGIWVPQAGIIDYAAVCRALRHRLEAMGCRFSFNSAVQSISRAKVVNIECANGTSVSTAILVNCAGLYADNIARMTGHSPECRILPFRGEFYQLAPEAASRVRHLVYPVPDMRFPFLGVHFTKRLAGGVEVGPNAVLAFAREGYRWSDMRLTELADTLRYPGFYRMSRRYWKKGIDEMYRSLYSRAFYKSVKKMMPSLRREQIKRTRSGVRAQCVDKNGEMVYDYLVMEDEQVINLVNAPSPAATSAFSIAEFIASKITTRLL